MHRCAVQKCVVKPLEAEQVRDFNKYLAAIVNVVVAKPVQVAAWIKRQTRIEVLQIAVVTEIDRRARMEQVGEEDIRVEIFGGLQRS